MPKEALFDLIGKQQYFSLLIIFGVYLLNWTVMLKLGLIIVRCNINTKGLIIPWALIGAFYSLLAKQIITNYLYFFATLVVLFLLMEKISKLAAAKVFWAAVVSLLTSSFSFLLFGQTSLINSKFRAIMFRPKGIMIGSLLEVILPAFFVLIYSNKAISKEKKDKTAFPHVILNISLLFLMYCLSAIVFYFLANYDKSFLWQVLTSELILIAITVYVLLRIRRINRLEQEKNEENHSTYLLKTILSKQREYRNFFQVIRMMAESGKTAEIIDYIDQIFAEMSLIDDANKDNCIFTSLQVAEEIKAKEKGVKIITDTKSDLKELKNPLTVYGIYKDLLQHFVAYEDQVVTDGHQIKVEVTEDEHYYSFKITRRLQAVDVDEECLARTTNPLQDRNLQQIGKRIKQLHGKFYAWYEDDELLGCLVKVGKIKRKPFPFPFYFGS